MVGPAFLYHHTIARLDNRKRSKSITTSLTSFTGRPCIVQWHRSRYVEMPLTTVRKWNDTKKLKTFFMRQTTDSSITNTSISEEAEIESPKEGLLKAVQKFLFQISSIFTLLFPIWTLITALLAVSFPSAFMFVTDSRTIELCLSLLMLSTGLTLTLSDLKVAMKRPRPLLFSLVCCYGLVPLLSVFLNRMFNLEIAAAAGLSLLAIISGGQASNLCTEIARGDTALSVAMTTLSTTLAPLALPALSSALLSTRIAVPVVGLAVSTAKLVLLPVLIGVLCNSIAPKLIKSCKPLLPPIGIMAVLALVAGPCAKSASIFRGGTYLPLLVPVLLLHTLGGIGGFLVASFAKAGRPTATALAFETGFKSPALAYVLACRHFVQEDVRLASAVSIVVLAPVAALVAVILRLISNRTKKDAEKVQVQVVGGWIPMKSEKHVVAARERRFRIKYNEGKMKVVDYQGLKNELQRARRKGKAFCVEEVRLSE